MDKYRDNYRIPSKNRVYFRLFIAEVLAIFANGFLLDSK